MNQKLIKITRRNTLAITAGTPYQNYERTPVFSNGQRHDGFYPRPVQDHLSPIGARMMLVTNPSTLNRSCAKAVIKRMKRL